MQGLAPFDAAIDGDVDASACIVSYGQLPDEVEVLLNECPDLYSVFDAANFRYNDADIDRGIAVSMRRPAYAHIKDAVYEPRAIVPSGEGDQRLA